MPKALTKYFATIDYEEGAVLTFPAGLPAFEEQRRFVLLERPATSPIVFLQSLDDAALCLPAVPIRAIDADYDLSICAEDLQILGTERIEELLMSRSLACLAVISGPESGEVTANLLAPIVIDLAQRRAVQAVRPDSRYSYRHPIAPVHSGEAPACWS